MLSWLTNPAVLGGVLLIVAGAILTYKFWRWDRPRGRKRCPKCWYDLSGHAKVERCPECGHEPHSERHLYRTRRKRGWAAGSVVMFLIGAGIVTRQAVWFEDVVPLLPTRVLITMLGRVDSMPMEDELIKRFGLTTRDGWRLLPGGPSSESEANRQLFVERAVELIFDRDHSDTMMRMRLLVILHINDLVPDHLGADLARLLLDNLLSAWAFRALCETPRLHYVSWEPAVLEELHQLCVEHKDIRYPRAFTFAVEQISVSRMLSVINPSRQRARLFPISYLTTLNTAFVQYMCEWIELDDETEPLLLEIVFDDKTRMTTRATAAERLSRVGAHGEQVFALLIEWIEQGVSEAMPYSAQTLGQYAQHSSEYTRALSALLTDSVDNKRLAAAAALSRVLPDQTLMDDEMRALIHVAVHDPYELAREKARELINGMSIEGLMPYYQVLREAAAEDPKVEEELGRALRRVEREAAIRR